MQDSSGSWRQMNNNNLGDLIRNIAYMIHDEPIVNMAIRILQSSCLGSGIQLKYGNGGVPTPNFERHIKRYFHSFCKDAIQSFLTVGFAPYRIRHNERGAKVPEILPLGTFSWSVAKSNQGLSATPWNNIGRREISNEQKTLNSGIDSQPLLKYEVNSSHCREKIHIHSFIQPQALFSCTSSMASLIQPYLNLCNKRECSIRADSFNSQPSIILEQQDKIPTNTLAERGGGLQNSQETRNSLGGDRDFVGGRLSLYHDLIDEFRNRSHLPKESVTFVAPKNHSVHSMDKVLSPLDVQNEEIAFARLVAMAIGIPCSILLQGGSLATGGANSASGGGGWSESSEFCNRMFLDTCRNINGHLEELMYNVYKEIYGSEVQPNISLPLTPTLPFEQLVIAHDTELIDDKCISRVLNTTYGFTLGSNAAQVRELKRKAEYILPFRDRKTPTGSS